MFNKKSFGKSLFLYFSSELFISLFMIFDFKLYYLFLSEIWGIFCFFYFVRNYNIQKKRKIFFSMFIVFVLINLISIILYLLDKYIIFNFGLINLLFFEIALLFLAIFFIKENDIRISFKKLFVLLISSSVISFFYMLIRICTCRPSLFFLLKIINVYDFPSLIRIGLPMDVTISLYCLLFYFMDRNSSPNQ